MHHGKHHYRRCEIIEIGRDNEGTYRQCPQQLTATPGFKQLCDKIETAVVIENFNDCHRSEQEEHDFRCPSHIFQEDIFSYKMLYRNTGCCTAMEKFCIFSAMETGHVICAITNVENPSHRPCKHSDRSLIHLC